MKKKTIRSILLTTTLTVGLSLSASTDAQAATYTVVKGDSLYKISKLYNTTVSNLLVANNFSGYDINIGQTIHIPEEKYTVVKNDTLFKIAEKYNISLLKLRQANDIWTDYIYVGQVLDIPLPYRPEENIVQETPPSINEPEIVQPTPEPVAPPKDVETPSVTPVVSYTNEELDLLARLIMAETESQPYEAKVAVGSVVVNRIQSGLFASTVSGVINQKIGEYYQFTPVQNGWINRPANEECYRAAKEALNGVDTTNGAIWYYDDSTTNQWILSKTVSVKYGRMVFALK
jgi:N-acetylmuramoyl-L-alanine amidase